MKRIFQIFLCFIMLFSTLTVFAEDAARTEPNLYSDSAVLMDYNTGRILYEKNADQKKYPASTTKVMTALLAVEYLKTDAVLTVSNTAVNIKLDGSNMGLLAGEEVRVTDLLYGLLLDSANDAANVIAEGVSGSIEEFVLLMNKKAEELKLSGTHFVNPHGYFDENHYTTAHDLAVISKEAMHYDLIKAIVATPTYTMAPTNKMPKERYFSTNNVLINKYRGHTYLYPYAKGIKTGYTSQTGYALASYAEKNSVKVISATLDAKITDNGYVAFKDAITLFNYCFDNFRLKTVAGTKEIAYTKEVVFAKHGEQAVLYSSTPLEAVLPNDYDKTLLTEQVNLPKVLKAPIKANEIIGTALYSYDGTEIGSVELVSKKDIPFSLISCIEYYLFNYILRLYTIIPIIIILIILVIYRTNTLSKRQKERARKRMQNRNMNGF